MSVADWFILKKESSAFFASPVTHCSCNARDLPVTVRAAGVKALRDPLILSRESIRRNRSVEQTSPTGWTLHNVARLG